MKNFLIVFILVPLCLFGQAVWDDSGIAVRQAEYIDWQKNAVSFGNETIYFWTDSRRGDSDIWAQKVDEVGNKLWADDVLVCGEINTQRDISVTKTGNNSVIIAWFDMRNNWDGDIYAQKINTNGEILWNNQGIPICTNDDAQWSVKIVEDSNDGAYIFWADDRNSGAPKLYCNRVLSNGDIATGWNNNGNMLGSQLYSYYDSGEISADGEGGAIAVWSDRRDSNNIDIYAQRVLPDGNFAWNSNSILICGADDIQYNPEITIGADQIINIVWRDFRNSTFSDLYLQKLTLSGQIVLTEDLCICDEFGIQRNPQIVNSDNSSIIVAWEDGRNENNYDYYDLYAQKIDNNGNILWEGNGSLIISEPNDQKYPYLISDSNGGCWITWEDCRFENSPWSDIYLQHVDENGNYLLAPDGIIICNEENRQFYPAIFPVDNNLTIIWSDERTNSSQIFTQVVDQNGNNLLSNNGIKLQSGICGEIFDYCLLPNNDNPIIIWDDDRGFAKQLYMQILNSDGSFSFQEDGIPLTNQIEDQYNPASFFDDQNDIVITCWEEDRVDETNIYSQAMDLAGNQLWDADGIRLSYEDIEQYWCQIDHSNGFYYTGWTDYNGDFINPVIKITGQKIDANGNLLWGDNGVLISDLPGDDTLQDIVGRYYIWQNEEWPDYDVYAKLVNEDGSTAAGWPEDGLAICEADDNQKRPQGFLTASGLLIIWEDCRTGHSDVYGQLVNSNGQIQWQENGLPLTENLFDIDNAKLAYNDENFYLIWKNYNSDSSDIYLQKFDYSGNSCWNEPVEFGINEDKTDPNISLCNNSIYTTWIEFDTYGVNYTVKAQLLDEAGNKLWQNGGEIVCENIYDRNKPLAVFDGNNHIYSIWQDNGSFNDNLFHPNLYAQKMYVENTGISTNNIPKSRKILTNYPNPFNPSTTISFNVTQTSPFATIEIYNLKGQKVKTFSNLQITQSSNHQIVWDGTDQTGKPVSSGIYFARLKNGNKQFTHKMLLMK